MTDERVVVRVPATSANLGPAFDCAGLALTCHDVVEFTVTAGGLDVAMSGEGAHSLPTGEDHLVVRSFRAACDELGWAPPGLRVAAQNRIPQGRGMGSSAAAVVAGVVGAWSLARGTEGIDPDAVLRLVTGIEGHPDNVAACLLGGAVLSWVDDGGARAHRLDVDPRIAPLVLVPAGTLSTHVARGLLPEYVPHADAAHNAGRAALLAAALTSAPELLLTATDDRLHQRQRGQAMPESIALVDTLRDRGLAAVVSGAGPSVLVLADASTGDPLPTVRGATPEGWTVLPLDVDGAGARATAGVPQVSSS